MYGIINYDQTYIYVAHNSSEYEVISFIVVHNLFTPDTCAAIYDIKYNRLLRLFMVNHIFQQFMV